MSDAPTAPPFVLSDRYDVAAEIGRGGFAVVYRARDRVLGRDVAIKILRDDSIPQSAMRRFSQEMQVTARLEHPNILHVYDTGTWEGRPYFVMEYVRGRTLEGRLTEDGVLPVADALAITREVALGLAFAHANGVVHRDVKPANILLGPGGALLGDFGIAHVLGGGTEGPITSTGFAVGTMQYMSPEQLCAEPRIDARSDQYSLALVCYEMLTGVRPYVASTVDALRALRLVGSFAPVSAHRPAAPAWVDGVMARALAPAPADRFRNVDEFLQALDGVATGERQDVSSGARRMKDSPARGNAPVIGQERSGETVGRRSGAPYVVGAAVLLAAVGLASGPWLRQRSSLASSARSVAAAPVIAFMPATTRDDSAFSARTRTEVGEWHDVSIASQGGAEGRGTGTASIDAFRAVAAGSGSTLVILPTVAEVGDSTRYSLAVYDFQSPRLTYIVRVRPSASALDAGTMREMIAHALVGPAADSAPGLAGLPVASLSAARGYVSAWRMVRAGAFDSARAAFAAAASGAPAFAQAHLWAAQTGAWLSPKDASGWRDDARRSIASPTALRGTDSLLASALVALAAGDPPGACDRYRAAIAREPDSFVAWYGLGQCQHVDRAVVRDARVPGGLRFRSSHWSAVAAYSEALARLPASGMSSLFVRVVNITYSSGNQLRAGVSLPPDTVRYVAFPSLSGDTVQTLPVPSARIARMDRGTLPETFSRALQRGRQALLEFTRTWITRAPAAADGWFQRAYALELAGAFDAPDAASSAAKALERANSLNADPVVRARIDVARTRVAVRRGEFDAALRMARGSLARPKALSPAVAVLQAPLAAFVGDVGATTSLLRTAATATDAADRNRLPPWVANSLTPWLADSLRAFGVRAMLGVCDGLQARKDQIEEAFIQHVPASDLAERRSSLLREVYRAAVPCLGPAVLRGLSPQIPLDHAIAALDARDPARARSFMRELDQTRSGMSASTLTEDAVLAETWVWLQTGDSARARAQLRANVNDWASISNFTFDEIAQAAALARVRAMVATP